LISQDLVHKDIKNKRLPEHISLGQDSASLDNAMAQFKGINTSRRIDDPEQKFPAMKNDAEQTNTVENKRLTAFLRRME
jgi:hypothetical protein